jgi:drug/metabolite transporter (DMT)-like permease
MDGFAYYNITTFTAIGVRMSQYTWLLFPIGAALSLAAADFFLKLSSSRISSNLVAFVYSLTTLVVPSILLWIARSRGEEITFTREGLVFAMLMGIAFSSVVVFLNMTFASGVNLSVGTPVIRTAGIMVASILGIIVFGEEVSWRYIFGFALTVAGLYFIVTR